MALNFEDLTKSSFEYKWELHDFTSWVCDIPTETKISSRAFSINISKIGYSTKWYIALYPNGSNNDEANYVSIYLHRVKDSYSSPVKLDCEFILVSSSRIYGQKKFTHVFRKPELSCGFPFIKLDILSKDFTNADDTLTIFCTIIVDNSEPVYPPINLSTDFGYLLESKQHCDVTLVSKDGSEHKAHKAILSCRSKVFSAMFEHDMKEKQENLVRIVDVDNKTLKEMLHFIYTGKIRNVENDITKKLFLLADKYDLDNLKETCVYYLYQNMNNDNVLDLLEFSNTYNNCQLKEKAQEYFLKHCKKILVSDNKDERLEQLSQKTTADLLYAFVTK